MIRNTEAETRSGSPHSRRIAIPINDLARHNAPLSKRLVDAIGRVAAAGPYILGPRARDFESAFAEYCGAAHCVGTANGTDALELALRACGVAPGQYVITVANAGGYSTSAILAAGALPAYVDIDPVTLLIDMHQVANAIRPGIAAIIATHLYGRMVDMPSLLDIAGRAGVPIIEDCAQAHGARLMGKAAGSWGACGCFSFYPTKNLGALGDGGAVVSNDRAIAAAVRELRQYGWRDRFRVTREGGRNSRLDELQAAVLLEKLPLLDGWNERRRDIAAFYRRELDGCGIQLLPDCGAADAAHLFVARLKRRDRVRARLSELGIGADVHYPVPDHRQEGWSRNQWAAVFLPQTETACAEVLTLPCFPELTDEEAAEVVRAVRRIVTEE
ncbi:MAG TPA: DegT/DnrJ/EryC1/StrS family aminotransferase [Bryobacteraceae bacterium]|nr:DegT/DnrJ/EryC1/StrS family aminotransferase [Bryobacteraceae bacterium]